MSNMDDEGVSAFSSESDSDINESHRVSSKKKKIKASSVEIIGSSSLPVLKTENPPKRNNRIDNNYYTISDASNTSTLIQVDNDNNPIPVIKKKRTCSSKLNSIISKLFCRKKKKEIATLTKEEKKKLLKKQKKRRNCCLIIFLIIIIIILLGNIAALDIEFIKYRNSKLSNITDLVDNGFTPAQEQNLKASMCSTILGTTPPTTYNCEFCWDDNSFYNVTTFCFLKTLYQNSNRTQFDSIGWLRDINYCRWLGVKCDESNNIIELTLRAPNTPSIIDARIGQLITLQKFTLIGTIEFPRNKMPASLFTMENLTELTIISTSLFGTIPNTFDKMTSLKSLTIRNNRNITDPIPDSISKTSLTTFIYSMHDVNTVIPDFIGNSPSLQQSLEVLDISNNKFTGTIPDSLMNLTKIRSLSLAFNNLTGDFPVSIITSKFAKTMIFINLGSNGFTGVIPPTLVQCSNLQVINFERNFLTGPIPSELSKLKLGQILLTGNKLNGTIPESIGNLNLSLLRLGSNALSGTIPDTICRNKYQFCDLQFNQFSSLPTTCSVCTF